MYKRWTMKMYDFLKHYAVIVWFNLWDCPLYSLKITCKYENRRKNLVKLQKIWFFKSQVCSSKYFGGDFFHEPISFPEQFCFIRKDFAPKWGARYLLTYILRGLLCATIDRRRSHPNNNKMCITVKFYYKTAN